MGGREATYTTGKRHIDVHAVLLRLGGEGRAAGCEVVVCVAEVCCQRSRGEATRRIGKGRRRGGGRGGGLGREGSRSR